jgi:hypothetical protein
MTMRNRYPPLVPKGHAPMQRESTYEYLKIGQRVENGYLPGQQRISKRSVAFTVG